MKKILTSHGVIALVLAVLWIIFYKYANSIHGGLDSIAEAIFASVMFTLVTGAFLLNIVLTATDIIIQIAPEKGKITVSVILLICYACALLYVIWSAYSFSYGRFFSYLAEGEFFSYLHVLFMIVLAVMIVIRARKLKQLYKR